MLIILAGITLNAVIGEDGIIFQAKDTKNLISNETAYDNAQLAQLQNELKDNQLYSGIGIIPGTDTGGSSEGGEQGNGTHGGTNQGGTGTNTSDGGSNNSQSGTIINNNKNNATGGDVVGGDVQDPTIRVIDGEKIAASFYRSDVTAQILTEDKTQKIKYVLTTTVPEINNELYPSGLVREIDIENGGTLTFTKNGEYTLTAYAYDVYGVKSNAVVMWFKIEKGTTPGNGVTVSVASGNMGLNDWYTSNITIRVLGTDTGLTRVTYRVKGTAMSEGIIGNREFHVGEIDTPEIEIDNGTTFKIEIDGTFSIVAYTYDGNMRLSTSTTLNVKRDASRPIITLYKGEQVLGQGFQITLNAKDDASNLANGEEGENKAGKRYTYRHKLAPNMTYTDITSQNNTQLYKDLSIDKTYDMYVIVKDNAGNMSASDVISKPALWVSKNEGSIGETGIQGTRTYYQGDIDVSLTGQDRNNVDIKKVTYTITGTTTGEGTMDGVSYNKGQALPETEQEITHNVTKTIPIRIDGNWTITVRNYNKENVVVSTNTLQVTRDTVDPVANAPTIATVKTKGEDGYYSEGVKIQMNGCTEDTSFKEMRYLVTGTATGTGTIGSTRVSSTGSINTGEIVIDQNGTFDVLTDGTWNVTAYVYDKSGRKSAQSNTLTFVRDTVAPTITSFAKISHGEETTIDVKVANNDWGVSGQATGGGYTYYRDDTKVVQNTSTTYKYTGLTAITRYIMKVEVKDKAGNVSTKSITVGTSKNFAYTGSAQQITLQPGKYKLEVWGAQGGNSTAQGTLIGGKGGYSSGIYDVEGNKELFIYVGGQGNAGTMSSVQGGWNGGGGVYRGITGNNTHGFTSGGGGTDICTAYSDMTNSNMRTIRSTTSYNSRLIVAGGGGGVGINGTPIGGAGGGLSGTIGSGFSNGGFSAGTQNGAGTSSGNYSSTAGFGYGATGTHVSNGCNVSPGGGGGYYGGGTSNASNNTAAAGGSGYIGGVTSGQTIDGTKSFPAPGGGNETGHSGNGYARITLVE